MRKQSRSTRRDCCEENTHLAVVFLAEATVMLAGDSSALVSLLGKRDLVENAHDSDWAVCCGRNQLLGKNILKVRLDFFMVPGTAVDELLHRRDFAVAYVERNRLDALPLGTGHQPLDVGEGVVLGFHFAEGWSEQFVELDQAVGCCAHVVFGHGGSSLTGPRIDDELASSSMLCSQ